MTQSMVIDFHPDGIVQAMHRDAFPLGFLGPQTIKRASDIRFNEETQKWDIWVLYEGALPRTIPAAKGFDGYDEARKMEVKWFDLCRLAGVTPLSPEGVVYLKELRQWRT